MWLDTKQGKRFFWGVITVATLLFGITAVNSKGFYQADEHYQIIEFAGWKLGTHEPAQLPWEFNHRIRPTLQPTIAWLAITALEKLGLNNPHSQMLFFRFLSGLTALVIITLFIRMTAYRFKEKWTFWVLVGNAYFLWFMPFLSVRFSSETWSGLLFLLGAGLYLREKTQKYDAMLIGGVFGLSFLFRFQMGLAILGFTLWLLTRDKTSRSYLLKMLWAMVGVVAAGAFLDSWFYGEWVFTPWNYLAELFRSKGEGFGEAPWYAYFTPIWQWPGAPVAILVALSLFSAYKLTKHRWLLWCCIPFLFVHILIPHKELRFLFPLVFLLPSFLAVGTNYLLNLNLSQKVKTAVLISIFGLIAVTNLPGLIVYSSKPAGGGYASITSYIDKHYGNQPVNLIYAPFANPYDPWIGVPMRRYMHRDIKMESIHNLCELDKELMKSKRVNLLVYRHIEELNPECNSYFQTFDTEEVTSTLPVWMENEFYGYVDKETRWNELILCRLD